MILFNQASEEPSMTECRSSINVCALRVARLGPDGVPVPGSTSAYGTGSIVTLGFNPVIEAGSEFTQKTGCGNICVSRKDCDKIKRHDMTISFCEVDYRLLELLTSGTLLTNDLDEIVGIADPGPQSPCNDKLSVEAWAEAWSGDFAADPGYIRHVFPLCEFRPDNGTLENGVRVYQVSGFSQPNDHFFDGPFQDLPELIGVTGWSHAELDDSALPTLTCGYQVVVAS